MKANAILYLDPRPKKEGFCTVKVKVTCYRQRRYYSTDIDFYYPETEQVKDIPDPLTKLLTAKRKTSEQKTILKKLNVYLNKAEKITESLNPFTFEKFEEAYLDNRDLLNSVSYAFEKRINDLRENKQIGTAVIYECAKNSLEDFKKDLTFIQITPKFLKQYEKQMLESGKSVTTISMYLRSLRALFKSKKIDKSLYPFGEYEIPSGRNIKKALTLQEIARIYNYEAEPGTYIERAKDYWFFLYLCNGMNVKDFCLLKWSNINGNILSYNRAKTKTTQKVKESITVALKPESLEIIRKWGQPSIDKDSFIFPHLNKGMTPERQRAVYQQLTKNINKHIKRIAKDVGINSIVTTYSARHSFATVLKRSGTNIAMISDLLGHSSLAVTQNYLAGFESEQIQEQTDVLTSFKQKKA